MSVFVKQKHQPLCFIVIVGIYLKPISMFVMVLSVKTVHYSRDSTVYISHLQGLRSYRTLSICFTCKKAHITKHT